MSYLLDALFFKPLIIIFIIIKKIINKHQNINFIFVAVVDSNYLFVEY